MNKIILIALLVTLTLSHKPKKFDFIENSNLSEENKQAIIQKMGDIWHNEDLEF